MFRYILLATLLVAVGSQKPVVKCKPETCDFYCPPCPYLSVPDPCTCCPLCLADLEFYCGCQFGSCPSGFKCTYYNEAWGICERLTAPYWPFLPHQHPPNTFLPLPIASPSYPLLPSPPTSPLISPPPQKTLISQPFNPPPLPLHPYHPPPPSPSLLQPSSALLKPPNSQSFNPPSFYPHPPPAYNFHFFPQQSNSLNHPPPAPHHPPPHPPAHQPPHPIPHSPPFPPPPPPDLRPLPPHLHANPIPVPQPLSPNSSLESNPHHPQSGIQSPKNEHQEHPKNEDKKKGCEDDFDCRAAFECKFSLHHNKKICKERVMLTTESTKTTTEEEKSNVKSNDEKTEFRKECGGLFDEYGGCPEGYECTYLVFEHFGYCDRINSTNEPEDSESTDTIVIKNKIPKEFEKSEEVEPSEEVEYPKNVEKPNEVEKPEEVKYPDEVRYPVEVEKSEEVEEPEEVEKPKDVEPSEDVEYPKEVEKPKEVLKPEEVEEPEEIKDPEKNKEIEDVESP